MPETKDKVSLNWHLTEKEKYLLRNGVYSSENQKELLRLKTILLTN